MNLEEIFAGVVPPEIASDPRKLEKLYSLLEQEDELLRNDPSAKQAWLERVARNGKNIAKKSAVSSHKQNSQIINPIDAYKSMDKHEQRQFRMRMFMKEREADKAELQTQIASGFVPASNKAVGRVYGLFKAIDG